jgi:hypothetical protein
MKVYRLIMPQGISDVYEFPDERGAAPVPTHAEETNIPPEVVQNPMAFERRMRALGPLDVYRNKQTGQCYVIAEERKASHGLGENIFDWPFLADETTGGVLNFPAPPPWDTDFWSAGGNVGGNKSKPKPSAASAKEQWIPDPSNNKSSLFNGTTLLLIGMVVVGIVVVKR